MWREVPKGEFELGKMIKWTWNGLVQEKKATKLHASHLVELFESKWLDVVDRIFNVWLPDKVLADLFGYGGSSVGANVEKEKQTQTPTTYHNSNNFCTSWHIDLGTKDDFKYTLENDLLTLPVHGLAEVLEKSLHTQQTKDKLKVTMEKHDESIMWTWMRTHMVLRYGTSDEMWFINPWYNYRM